jgi:hypothetical protein
VNAPTVDQLLILVGSAEKRRLTTAEAALLRVGIDLLADAKRQQAATIGGLQNRIRELKDPARPHPTAEEVTA